ncbi:alcohol acetyltransferase [Brachyspira murdochii]|uniref:alcohol acetyltransferase n=1 Tax=Brachyspira murdochii TaxID=84378 RepID=UPI0012F4927B|nr:alcohol acetyltransferase [Brachyspira murdochii]
MKHLYKLDNAAKLFVSIKNKKNIPIFRVSAVLKEEVNPQKLQEALDIAIKRYPTLALMIKKGLFWNYFEENHRKLLIQEDKYYPCYNINSKLNNGYLIRVGYYKYRVFAEIYHSLADATSLISFFKSLLYHYFILTNKTVDDKNEDIFKDNIHTLADYDDSFLVHTKNKKYSVREKKIKNVYLIKGKPFKFYGDNVVHGILDLNKVKVESKKYNVTITSYLLSLLAYSIYETRIKDRFDGKNIVVCLPVNLRQIFPSISLKNFFGVANIAIDTKNKLTFEDIIKKADKDMKDKISKERLENFIYENTKIENNVLAKFIPLFIKNFAVNLAFELFEDKVKTITLSNFGNITLPEDMKEYINHFEAVVYPTINSPLNCGICSFDNKLSITFSRTVIETDIIKYFFKYISNISEIKIYSNDFGVL